MHEPWECDQEENLPLAERLKRGSDRIVNLILHSDLEWIDIQLDINRLRELCANEAPAKLELFDALYTERFYRIWEQWREGKEGAWDEEQTSGKEEPWREDRSSGEEEPWHEDETSGGEETLA
ncbi:MAG: hypothetical protein NTX50_27600 [Candidatus Sumerlaeota bacterium]|nr:hypothetical protein [Candidatus Sumerlaeota bacterium]